MKSKREFAKELRESYEKTGASIRNTDGDFDIDYVLWLENEVFKKT